MMFNVYAMNMSSIG